jgi:hypothetical protein
VVASQVLFFLFQVIFFLIVLTTAVILLGDVLPLLFFDHQLHLVVRYRAGCKGRSEFYCLLLGSHVRWFKFIILAGRWLWVEFRRSRAL